MASVLCIDDEAGMRESLRKILEFEGHQFRGAANGEEGLQMVHADPPDLVFLDIKMPGMDGLEVLERLRAMQPMPPVVIMSGHGTIQTAVHATRLGAYEFIEKPLSADRIRLVTRNALAQKRLREENQRLQLSFDKRYRIVGESAALQKALRAVQAAAPTKTTILISGESGVGKELVARAIHGNSLRKLEAFVQVNCAAIPEELIESELFGHEKGSFAGAAEKQIGKFELAHRGTIFLDEVGDMSLKTQAKVLRVLQEGEVERIGSQNTLNVDVRVIAATNKRLEDLIEQGTFREDLYFRLSVLPIRVPSLNERSDDIPLLAEYFVTRFCDENNFRRRAFSKPVLETLARHPWRGNVRELKNTVERILILTATEDGSVIEMIPSDALGLSASAVKTAAPSGRLAARRVFVVHGHDEGARESVARFLEKVGLEPVILSEVVSGGMTIIEKIESHGDVGFAVVLLTPDDEGRGRAGSEPPRGRARQNVVAELGYFIGRLQRERVCLLRKGDVEWPSDFAGCAFIEMDDKRAWQVTLARELKAARMSGNFEKLLDV
jgi:two-component system nitrogen regulation response regulator NtrX